MDNLELWKILISIISAYILFIIKDSYYKARKQKEIAIRLSSYLFHWKNILLEHSDWFNLYYVGIDWNEQEKQIVNNKGTAQELVDLKNKIKEQISNNIQNDATNNIEKLEENILKRIKETSLEFFHRDISLQTSNILHGKTFITDEEASILGSYISTNTIGLKTNLVSAIESFKASIIILVTNPTDYTLVDNKHEVINMVWNLILASRYMDKLEESINIVSNTNLFKQTITNLLHKN